MSLVIAFIGTHGAVMAGDMREITTQGNSNSTETLEHELYSGMIVTDEDLKKRAVELGILITIRDDKNKVSQRDGILIGEVSETEGGIIKKRRLYATAGEYALAEIENGHIRLTGKWKGSNFVVLGNEITKKIAHTCIQQKWHNGSISDAIKVIILTMKNAAEMTASVSRPFIMVRTASEVDLATVIERDIMDKKIPSTQACDGNG